MSHGVTDASNSVNEQISSLSMLEELENEVMYYRSLFMSDLNPTNASIINSLRVAADIREDFEKFKAADSVAKLMKLCNALERENAELKRMLRESSKV
jgi:hypothetical protein